MWQSLSEAVRLVGRVVRTSVESSDASRISFVSLVLLRFCIGHAEITHTDQPFQGAVFGNLISTSPISFAIVSIFGDACIKGAGVGISKTSQ